MKLTVTVCNICRDMDAPTNEYEIKHGIQRARLDLCQTHAEPLEELLKLSPTTPRKTTTRTSNRAPRTRKVTSMDEIEKLKN